MCIRDSFFFARYISLRRTHSHLTRRILVGLGGEPEAQLLSADRLTDVVVCETPDDEKTFWTKRFASALRTSAVPTVAQVDAVKAAFVILCGLDAEREPLATPEEVVALACADSANSVLRAVVFALLCEPALCRADAPEPAAAPKGCLLYTSPSPRDATLSRMPSSA